MNADASPSDTVELRVGAELDTLCLLAAGAIVALGAAGFFYADLRKTARRGPWRPAARLGAARPPARSADPLRAVSSREP